MKTYTAEIISVDDITGDGVLQFPEEFIITQDWREGDQLTLKVEDKKLIICNNDWEKRQQQVKN